jgi:transposase
MCATRLYREIREQGFTAGYEVVKRWCRRWRREERAGQATVRFETPPGLQAQADRGESRNLRFSSGEVVTRCFFTMVLAFSQLRFVVYLPQVTQAWLLWAHTRAFAFFQGVPQRILYDNPKQLVKRPRPDLVWQERLLAFASHYGFLPQACWRARPQTKGKVENAGDVSGTRTRRCQQDGRTPQNTGIEPGMALADGRQSVPSDLGIGSNDARRGPDVGRTRAGRAHRLLQLLGGCICFPRDGMDPQGLGALVDTGRRPRD